MAINEFTKPKLYTGKSCFVGFSFNGKRYQVRMGINYLKKESERLQMGKGLCQNIEGALTNGWDPGKASFEKFISDESRNRKESDINHKSFIEAIDFALNNGSWAKKTNLGYKCTADFFKKAAKELGLEDIPIQKLTKQHVLQMAAWVKKDRKWSNVAYNKNVGYFSGIISVLTAWEIIPHNPAHDIKRLPVTETNKYEPYTKAEKKKIYEALHDKHYLFYVFFMVVYHTGARPKEVLALRISDIKFDLQEIQILPDLEEENSKTKTIRRIPINPHLLQLLESLQLGDNPSDYYVFGSPYEQGRGNSGKGLRHPDYFRPSATRIKRDTVTKLWKELIWKGAGVHKYLYAAKHTGGDDKILAGVDLDALRDLYGHSSKQMTEKYVSRLKEVHKKKIIEKSPDFL